MTRLSVNLNKIALLRNSRNIGIPSVTGAAEICLRAGARGITVHPRPDERHIRRGDVHDLSAMLRGRPGVEFNIEGNPTEPLLELACEIRPDQCTLVPDSPEQLTSDHGWDARREADRLAPIVGRLRAAGIRVSLFMDPDPAQIECAARTGANRIELYTEPYARAHERGDGAESIRLYAEAARRAGALGMGVNAGHDLNLANLGAFLAGVPGVLEVSIGHALIADALEMGLEAAAQAYLKIAGDGG